MKFVTCLIILFSLTSYSMDIDQIKILGKKNKIENLKVEKKPRFLIKGKTSRWKNVSSFLYDLKNNGFGKKKLYYNTLQKNPLDKDDVPLFEIEIKD